MVEPNVNGQSVYYAQMNAGKRNIVVDFRQPAGAEIVAKLADASDVLLENFRPGVLDKYSLGAAVLRARNPSLIYCSVSGWGQTGRWAQRRAYAPLIHAETGHLELSGRLRNRAPEQEVHVVADLNTGFFALSAILAALYQRERTGEGQHLDIAMAEVFTYCDDWAAVDLAGSGTDRQFDIWNHPIVELADGTFAALTGNRFRMAAVFLEAMGGDPALVNDDPLLATYEARVGRTELIDTLLNDVSRQIADFATLEAIFDKRGLLCAQLRSLRELTTTPWAEDRDAFATVEPGVVMPRSPWRSDTSTIGVAGPAPRAGEHTETVLRELGYRDDDIDTLRAADIVR